MPGWRWVFLVNLPIGALLTWLTVRSLPESRDDRARPVDFAGMATFGIACFLATLGLIRGNEDGWGSTHIAGSLAAALLSLIAFIAVERRSRAPMLPLSLVLAAVAPISGRLTGRWPLRVPLATGLMLIGAALLLMRSIDASSD